MKANSNWKKCLILLGGGILLISWISQNILHYQWQTRLTEIQSATLKYAIYLSNTYVMNNIEEIDEKKSPSPIEWNVLNFRLGLQTISEALPSHERSSWKGKINNTQKEGLNDIGVKLMKKFSEEQERIKKWEQRFRLVFIGTYLLGTFSLLIGQFLKDG